MLHAGFFEIQKPVPVSPIRFSYPTTAAFNTGREQYKGSVLRNFNEVVYGTANAQVNDGVLWINKLKFKGSFFFRTKNYTLPALIYFIKTSGKM